MAPSANFLIRAAGWLISSIALPAKTEERLVEATGVTIDSDEHLYRPLTGDSKRDLTPITQERMQKMALYLWETNMLVNRMIELPIAYMLAQGCKLTVADDTNQKALDKFWNDPINEMDMKLPKKLRELSIFGEQCYPAFVQDGDGLVRLGYLDPARIAEVVTDPDNPEQPIGIITKKDKYGKPRKYKVIINGPEDVFTDRTQAIRKTDFSDGQCFYFRVNDLSSGSRGRSDMLAQIDWADAYEEFLFGELDRSRFLRSFLWDVTLTNATPEQVKARAAEITAPAPNSVRVHNDAEVWADVTPSLQSGDSKEQARLFRNHILGGGTMPETWFGGGGDVNRSTAGEMSEPTFKIYSMRQNVFRYMLVSMGKFQLRMEFKRNNKDGEPDFSDDKWKVQAEFPEMISKDVSKFTAALAQAAAGAAVCVAQGFTTKLTACRILAKLAAELGVDFDPEVEIKAALNEMKQKQLDDADIGPLPGSEEEEPSPGGAPEKTETATAS